MSATEATVAFDATGGGSGPSGEDEVSVKAFAEELKDLADSTHVLGSETGTAEGHSSFIGAHRVRSGDDGEASYPQGSTLPRSLSPPPVYPLS